MANNVFVGPNSVVAKQTATFADMGFNDTNVSIIYEIGNSLKSWVPGRSINGITGTTPNKGYYIVSLVDADLTAFFRPDFLTSGQVEQAATFSAITNSVAPRWIRVGADENKDGEKSMYFHTGTAIEFHYLIGKEYLIAE